MNLEKTFQDYANTHNWSYFNNCWQIANDISARVSDNTIRICDERNEKVKYELPFEENPYEDKSAGLFYSIETEEFYNSIDSIIEYILSGAYLKSFK